MTRKIGRNDRCPCGSGKKYKQCCGADAASAQTSADSPDGAVERALSWLDRYHRKAFAAALQAEIDGAVFALFDDETEATDAIERLEDQLLEQLHINLTEWLLAEGDIVAKGVSWRIAELLLSPSGPPFTAAERSWLEQLAARPLRLYDVTEVVPGVSLTLCDALDGEQPPQVVIEQAGSRALRAGARIGARVMAVDGQFQFSGALYAFSDFGGQTTLDQLRAISAAPSRHPEDNVLVTGLQIIEGWLAQFLLPARVPDIVDMSSGEPLLFVTDRYEVGDWPALAAALGAQPDVHGDVDAGWDRPVECDDGQTRSLARIVPEPDRRQVLLQYSAAGSAQQGRVWFDALAGGSVTFIARDIVEPKDLISRPDGARGEKEEGSDALAKLDPEALAGAMEGVIQSYYANWADEPVPALNGQTPREAIGSAAGLERVKGLLRSYEQGEAEQAAQQGRREIPYRFLWEALGLTR